MSGGRSGRTGLAVSLCLALCCATARAEGNATGEKYGAFTLGEIEILEQADAAPQVTAQRVKDRDMRKFEADTLDAVVNLVPGVTLSTTGARNERMVSIRGMDQKHVPIYLDGIPLYVPYDGYPDLSRFTTYDLSTVIVSKGFSSVLYGPNTMGGAINMVSKRPKKSFEGVLGFGAGSYSYNGYMGVGTNQGLWYIQADFSHADSDGFPLSQEHEGTTTENGGRRENAYHQDSKVGLKIGLTPNERDEYALTYIKQHGKKGTPPYAGSCPTVRTRYWRWPYWDKESLYFNSNTWISDNVYVKTRLYYDIFQNSLESYDDASYSSMKKKSSFKSAYDDHTLGGSLELGTYAFSDHELKMAAHFKRDYHCELAPKTPDVHFKEDLFSVGLEDTWHFTPCMYAVAGISFDHVNTRTAENLANNAITAFEKGETSAVNPQVGLFYTVGEKGLAHASVAMKSRMPSIKDKFSYRLGTALPNPDLDPEHAINCEAGYRHTFDQRITVEGTIFFNDVSDYILQVTIPDPDTPGATLDQNQNIGEVDVYGVELALTATLWNPLNLGMNYTYLRYDNHTNDDELLNTPTHKLFAYVEYRPWKRLALLADVRHESDRYSSSSGDREAEGFTVAGVKATYEFLNGKFVEMGVNNIFDANYELEEGYPQAGQTWFANVRLEF